jgi:formylglycine-generating enzyme required for sulfatase activity
MNKLEKVNNQLSRLDASIHVANKLLAPRANPYNMVFVEGGTFMMGCTAEQGDECYDNEKPAHQVTLSSYYIGKYPVIQAEWEAVMGNNPSHFKGARHPVECVSWDDVQVFLERLNAQTGINYRLPTEAEWEYAARGGKYSQGFKYSGGDDLEKVAWFDKNSGQTTHEAGLQQPNELDLYDMSGNLWEWCSDWYGSYSSDSQTNPVGPANGAYRVLRGGSWIFNAQGWRVSDRGFSSPVLRSSIFGFRLVSPSL